MSFYTAMYRLLAPAIRLLFRVKITGAENEPDKTGFMVCANHLSMADVVVLAASLKKPVHYFAKAELFKIPFLRGLITILGAMPVNRGSADVGAIKNAVALIKSGCNLGIYPQGTRCPGVHPSTTSPKSGAGLIAYKAQSDVLPVHIKTKDYRIGLFKRTEIIIGKPIAYEEFGFTNGSRAEYTAAAKKIFDAINDLSPN